MVSIGAKFFQSFRNLKPDAVPRPPRPENVNINNENSRNEDNDDDTASVEEEIIIEPDDSQEEEEKKSKSKKSFFFPNKKKRKNSAGYKKDGQDPASPIQTHASGNVINIVNCKDVQWGNTITYNLGTPQKSQNQNNEENEKVKKTNAIVLLMESTAKPKHDHIDCISKNLGKNWYSFFKALGYSQGKIETMEIDEARNGVSQARYKLLLDWIRNDDDGTLGRLSTLLWHEGEREIVKELATIYKNSTNA